MEDVPLARHDLQATGYAFGAIQTTRGYPLNRSFCNVTAFNGAHYQQRPIPDVVREFQLRTLSIILRGMPLPMETAYILRQSPLEARHLPQMIC